MKQSIVKQPQTHREVKLSTRLCPECGQDLEWDSDFRFEGIEVVVHKCAGCSLKEVRRYASECPA